MFRTRVNTYTNKSYRSFLNCVIKYSSFLTCHCLYLFSFRSEGAEENRDIIIYNFDAEINDNLEIVNKVYDLILKNYLSLTVTRREIESVTKLGHDPTWKRPVIITFTTYEFKKEVLRLRKYRRCGNYKVENFIPREVMLEQKKFVEEAKKLRKQGKRVHLRDGKFIVDGVVKRNFYREYRDRLKQQALADRGITMKVSNITSTNSNSTFSVSDNDEKNITTSTSALCNT